MAAFSRLCALCHFDLNFLGRSQILGGYAESAGCHLLDGRTFIHGTACGHNTLQVFAAFTAIGFAADAVHGNCHALMGFLRNGTVGHRTCFKPAHNGFYAFHFFYGNAAVFCELKVQRAAERNMPIFCIDTCRILLE